MGCHATIFLSLTGTIDKLDRVKLAALNAIQQLGLELLDTVGKMIQR